MQVSSPGCFTKLYPLAGNNMNNNKVKRYILSFIISVSWGFLLSWILTFKQGSPEQLLSSLSIIGLLLFSHILSTQLFGSSILVIHSYIEGILFFVITMITFRIGDHLLGITNLSFLTEAFLLILSALSGSAYVWTMRRAINRIN